MTGFVSSLILHLLDGTVTNRTRHFCFSMIISLCCLIKILVTWLISLSNSKYSFTLSGRFHKKLIQLLNATLSPTLDPLCNFGKGFYASPRKGRGRRVPSWLSWRRSRTVVWYKRRREIKQLSQRGVRTAPSWLNERREIGNVERQSGRGKADNGGNKQIWLGKVPLYKQKCSQVLTL